MSNERLRKMSKVQIQNFNEREIENINNPRKVVFLTDILCDAVIYAFVTLTIAGAIVSVCALCGLGIGLMGV